MKDNFDIYEWRLKQAINEAVPFNRAKSDLNNDDIISPYEKKRGMAIAKNMDEQPVKMHHDATDLEEKLHEDDWMQPDDEADMAYSQLSNIKRLSTGLCDMIDQEEQLDAWVQAKLTKAEDYLQSVYGYLYGEESNNHKNQDPNKQVILGNLNEVNPNDLQVGKSYKYTGTVPGGADSAILIFKGIKKYNDGKDHYYFTNNQGTGALFSYNNIINNLTSID
jgi:hypothetical protein